MPADAEENFELLKAKKIRARVTGKDISDDVHWSEYYRKDGALISTDIVTKQTGTWKIQGDNLCKSKEKTKPLTSYEVWMFGDKISLRLHEGDAHFIGVVEKHDRPALNPKPTPPVRGFHITNMGDARIGLLSLEREQP